MIREKCFKKLSLQVLWQNRGANYLEFPSKVPQKVAAILIDFSLFKFCGRIVALDILINKNPIISKASMSGFEYIK